MEKIKFPRVGEEMYHEKLENGLNVFVFPKAGFRKGYAFFATNYGGNDTRFCLDGEWHDTPAGVAHYLEHKMFDTEDGNALQDLAAQGASPNAFTSSAMTGYYFESTENFKENLRILLSFVSIPYFTKESVDKEQGIIGQEIDMYKDSPEWECFFNLLDSMYVNHPVKIDIAGTKESIAQITADMLFSCYDTFYNLSNMALAVAGKTTVEEVLEIADRLLEETEKVTVERAFLDEPEDIVRDYVEENLPVATPVFAYGFKENHDTAERTVEEEIAMLIILEIIAGQMSPLYKHLLDADLINTTFSTEYFNGYNYAAPIFSGESSDPHAVCEKIKEAIAELKNNGISEEEFEIVRKKQYGKTVRAFSDIDTVANGLVTTHFANDELFAEFNVVKNMKL